VKNCSSFPSFRVFTHKKEEQDYFLFPMFWFLFRYDALIFHPLASAASMTSSDTLRNCEPGTVNVAAVVLLGKAFNMF